VSEKCKKTLRVNDLKMMVNSDRKGKKPDRRGTGELIIVCLTEGERERKRKKRLSC